MKQMKSNTTSKMVAAVAFALAVGACSGKSERISSHLDRGNEHFTQGDYDKARVEFKNVLQMDPKNAAAAFAMGQTLEKLGDVRAAAGFFQKTLDLTPTNREAKLRLARMYILYGATEQADKLAKEVLQDDPQNVIALVVQAGVRMRGNDTKGAESDVRQALSRDPNSLDAIFLLASVLTQTQRMDEAVALLKSSLATHGKEIGLHSVLASLYAEKNQATEAEAELKNVIALAPDDFSHRLRLAQYLVKVGQKDKAEATLRDAVTAATTKIEPKLALVDFLNQEKSAEVATREIETFVAREQDNADLRFGHARLLQQIKEPAKAKSIYEDLIAKYKLKPEGLRARNELARVLLTEKNTADAIKLVTQVLQENPRDRDGLLLRASMAMNNNDPVTAISDYREVLKDDSSNAKIMSALALAHSANHEPALAKDTLQKALSVAPNDVDAHVQLARLYVNENQLDQAAVELKSATQAAPQNIIAWEGLMKIYLQKRDWQQAQLTVDGVRAAFPDAVAPDFLTGVLRRAEGKRDDAIKAFNRALERQPEAIEPLAGLVSLYLEGKQTREALAAVDKAAQKAPKSAAILSLKGEVLSGDKRYPDAAQSYRKAIAIDASEATYHKGLAAALLATGDSAAAIAALEQGLKATQGESSLYMALAALQEQQKQYDKAIATYDTLLAQHPESQTAANNLAMLLVSYRGDAASLGKAKTLVDPLRKSDNPAFLDTVGWLDVQQGNAKAAVPALEQALKTVPDSPLLRYHLGMAYFKDGNRVAAGEHLSKALEGNTAFYGRDEAQATLKQLASNNM